MKRDIIKSKLSDLASIEKSSWIEEAEQRLGRRDWVEKSARIALRILNEIKSNRLPREMSQKILATKMGVSEQYISKVLKGQENLSLETISKFEKALGISLIEIPKFKSSQEIQVGYLSELVAIPRYMAKKVHAEKSEVFSYDKYIQFQKEKIPA